MQDRRIPSIAGIQLTNLILLAIVAAGFLVFGSLKAATSCAFGGAFMISNLFTLTVVGKAMLMLARGGGGFRARLAASIFPIKLLLLGGILYLLFANFRVDSLGFIAGVLTQFVAIIIETARVWFRDVPMNVAVEN